MEERLINFVTNPPALFESIGNFFLPIFIFVGDTINSSPILSATAGLAIILGSGIYAKIIWEGNRDSYNFLKKLFKKQ